MWCCRTNTSKKQQCEPQNQRKPYHQKGGSRNYDKKASLQAMVIFQLQRHFRKVPLKQKWNASLHVEIFRKNTTPAPLEGVVFDQLVRSNLKLPLQPHDPTTRWQRDRKKQQQQQLGLEGNTKTLHVRHTFFTFLYRFCTSTTGNFLILHFMEDVNKRRRYFISLSELG